MSAGLFSCPGRLIAFLELWRLGLSDGVGTGGYGCWRYLLARSARGSASSQCLIFSATDLIPGRARQSPSICASGSCPSTYIAGANEGRRGGFFGLLVFVLMSGIF